MNIGELGETTGDLSELLRQVGGSAKEWRHFSLQSIACLAAWKKMTSGWSRVMYAATLNWKSPCLPHKAL